MAPDGNRRRTTGSRGGSSRSRRSALAAGWKKARSAAGNVWQSTKLRLRRTRAWLRARPAISALLVTGVLGTLSLAGGLLVGSWQAVCRDCPSIAQIYGWEPKSATQILDRKGKLISELFTERRTPVRIETLPEYVPHAFVAIEDKRFYQHHGFDFRRLIGANLRNIFSLRITGGGSTITQQLARWMFTEEIGFRRTGWGGPVRKLKEAKVARELEEVYTKDQILEAYINQVNYGDGRHGIEAASQYFFGKAAVQLDPAEAALLAAVINRPTSYSPFRNPERARGRRNLVLTLMASQGWITRAQADSGQKEALPDAPHRSDEGKVAPYFVEYVRDILDDKYGSDLYSKGYRVTTTLDLDMQLAAQAAMDTGWARIEHQPSFRGAKYAKVKEQGGTKDLEQTAYLQGMFLALDPANGGILAMIGGRDFDDSKFNRSVQALRQPGSTFKPFTYTSAIASGIPASHVINDSPLMLELPEGGIYSPKNYEPEFRGPLTLRDALKFSINTVAVKLGMEVGMETVAQTAHQLGITTDVPPYPSTAIGAPSVLPIQMVEAYTTFANTGVKVKPRPIQKVEDADGRLLWETFPERDQVLDSAVAAIMRDMMRTALDNGSGQYARQGPLGLSYDVPAAGKTGTTNDATDIWFIGFTPDILAAVWFGFDKPRPILPRAAGGVYAAPVWGQFMHEIYYGKAPQYPIPEPWPWPENITTRLVDRETGKLASSWCPSDNAYEEHYLPGTEPTEVCRPSAGLFGGPAIRRLRTDTLPSDSIRRPHRRMF